MQQLVIIHVALGQTIWLHTQQLTSGFPSREMCCWWCLQGVSRSRS